MHSVIRAGASGIGASVVLLAASAPATAAPAPISGTLSAPGYTVVGLAQSGEARTVRVSAGQFSLVPPTEAVTLHLRAPNGTYAGPVVLKDPTNSVRKAKAKVRKAKRKLRRAKRTVRAAETHQQLKRARVRRRRAAKRLRRAERRLERAKQIATDRRGSVAVGVEAGAVLGKIAIRSGYASAGDIPKPAWRASVDPERRALAQRGAPIGAGNFGVRGITAR